ncbi:hypothetical protein Q4I28_005353 [Leishmania naiffi]|uniref:Uncharacterized protein n=1 Tax=Leishmania naiffi TaxID=5678 RepID=A0AAW3BJ19_9TRYP
MDVPLRLRLAYANCLNNAYCDRRNVRCDAKPLSCDLSYTSRGAEHDGRHWLSSLVASVGSNQSEEALLHTDLAVSASLLSPLVATEFMEARAPQSSYNADPQLQGCLEKREAVDQLAAPSPRPSDNIGTAPFSPRTESPVDEMPPESPHTPFATFSKTAPLPPASPFGPDTQEATRVESAVQANVAAQVEADAAARARTVRVNEELAGTHEALLVNVTAALEQRLRECVLKTVALDDAQQQLICAFQLRSSMSPASPSPHPLPVIPSTAEAFHASSAPPTRDQLTKQAAPARTDVSSCATAKQDAASGEVADVPAAKPAAVDAAAPPPWLSANRTDASLSDDVKKEVALHLYALSRQVQQLRSHLEAHESTHYRHVNALRAAQRQRRGCASLPLRVEIIKGYEDDPVPYRKGPWREADFAAARRGGQDLSAGGMRGNAASDESYISDDFTEVTSATSSVVRTGAGRESDGVGGADGSSSTVSSTEELFRQRQAAALRVRNQQTVARSVAVNAASSPRNRMSDSSTDYSSSLANTAMTTDTRSASSLTTTTSTDDDSDSD